MTETTGGTTLNPWFSIWVQPRATIQQIIDSHPTRLVLLLAAVAGFSQFLDRAVMKNLGDRLEWPMIFAIAAVAGPVMGVVGLYIGGALLRWTGGWLGGRANPQQVRAAIAWSSVPLIWALPLWIPELALFGQDLFTKATPRLDANPLLAVALIGFGLVELIIGIWAIVVFLKCLGQVQGFSAWRALGNALLAFLIVFTAILVPILLIGGLVAWLR